MPVVKQDQTHGVIIPSYNSGSLLEETVEAVLKVWLPVIVVLDGCTDGSAQRLGTILAGRDGVYVIELPENRGKGAAVLAALSRACVLGWTHAVVFDSDGQHAVEDIPRFMAASKRHPQAMVLGVPVFGEDAPGLRVWGRCIGNWWTNLETLWGGIRDSLYGFRVYPVHKSLQILAGIWGGKRFDFDTQLAVRLYWEGVVPLNISTRVVYRSRKKGGVSHFRYVRDNVLLTLVHVGLVCRALCLIPRLVRFRQRPALEFS
jgi:glycosyltransferase involved in cell wall biosynthesis